MPTPTHLILILSLVFISGCASKAQKVNEIQPGWDKSDVVESAGNPSRTYRKNSVDHWVYKYFEGETPLTKVISFKGGKVVAVSSGKAHSKVSAPYSKQEMLEYKEALEKKRQSQSGFKDID